MRRSLRRGSRLKLRSLCRARCSRTIRTNRACVDSSKTMSDKRSFGYDAENKPANSPRGWTIGVGFFGTLYMARSGTRPVDQGANLLRELTMATTGFMGSNLQSQGEETFFIPIDIALDERFELFTCRHGRAPPLNCRIERKQSHRLCCRACIMPSKHPDRNS